MTKKHEVLDASGRTIRTLMPVYTMETGSTDPQTGEPIVFYKVVDPEDGEAILSGLEVVSKVEELTRRQVDLMRVLTGLPGHVRIVKGGADA